jgi:hypothetical protein
MYINGSRFWILFIDILDICLQNDSSADASLMDFMVI